MTTGKTIALTILSLYPFIIHVPFTQPLTHADSGGLFFLTTDKLGNVLSVGRTSPGGNKIDWARHSGQLLTREVTLSYIKCL